MAEINKLDVGKALDKMRGAETPKARMTQLDEKIGAIEDETRRMRAMSHQVDRGQRVTPSGRDAQETKAKPITTAKVVWIVAAIIAVILLLVWAAGLL